MRGQCDPVDPRRARVTMHHFEETETSRADDGRLVYEGTACFTDQPAGSISPLPLVLEHPRRSKFTAEQLYSEQWLFHGPPMQALTEVGPVSQEGISGTIAVLPLSGLLGPGQPSSFHGDPIVLDTFTHLLGCWGLDCLSQGDVIFPLRMGRMTLFGIAPPIGTPLQCRIHVRDIHTRFVSVDAEIVRPDGLVWIQVRDWQDWRFYWPARYRDVFCAPDKILVGEPLPLRHIAAQDAVAVWLAPPRDMARPVWRDVLEQIQLAPEERSDLRVAGGSEVRRTHRLWGRIAAKEAVRRLWLAQGCAPRYPADLAIESDPSGRPRIRDRARPEAADLPAVSTAHAEGVVVALAASLPGVSVGIDIEPIHERVDERESRTVSPAEHALQQSCAGLERGERTARLRAAKQAAAKAAGLGPLSTTDCIEVLALEADTGHALVAVGRNPDSSGRDSRRTLVRVYTELRGEHIWAWTLGEKIHES
jgi:phosphopantetheinyl transferase